MTVPDLPPVWEMERTLADVFCENLGVPRRGVTPATRLSDFPAFDSLDLVELVMEIEETYRRPIPSNVAERMFLQKHTFHDFAVILRDHWLADPTPLPAPQPGWFGHRRLTQARSDVPFTQGLATAAYTPGGPLYKPLPPNREGHPQYHRLTDGMRCVLVRAGGTEFLIDAEPVACAAYATFLNTAAAPDEVVRSWCGVPDTQARDRHFPLRRTWSKQWEPAADARWPMVLVSWHGAAAYARWAHGGDWRADDGGAALPTQRQWEAAADGPAPADSLPPHAGIHERGRDYAPADLPLVAVNVRQGMSRYGLHHALGNVWQWCRDEVSPGIRAERGGSWVGPAELAAVDRGRGRDPSWRGRCLGFRCAGDPAAVS